MKKLFISLVLIFLFSLSSMKIYAMRDNESILYLTEGNTHELVSQDMGTTDGKLLVPTGAILGVNDTEEVVFKYVVFVQYGINVDYYIDNLEINKELASSEVSELFDFEFKTKVVKNEGIQIEFIDGHEAGYYVEISLIVTMDFPTPEQYLILGGQQLSFDIFFVS